MPTYDFKNTVTGEIITRVMKISEREEFLKENPELETYISSITIGDPVRLGVRKIDNGFKEVLQKIHTRTPGSTLDI
jgi:hypothetical protein